MIPLSEKNLVIPSKTITLNAINESFFGRSSKEKKIDLIGRTIKVKPLPDHPLKGNVPVGVFSMKEGIDRTEVKTGDNIIYSFEINGTGNLPFLLDPSLKESDSLLVLKESDKLTYSTKSGLPRGKKVYLYNIVPQISGSYKVKDFIHFPYFNYKTCLLYTSDAADD